MGDNITNRRSGVVKTIVALSLIVLVLAGLQPWLWATVRSWSVSLHELRTQAEQIEEIKKRIKDTKSNYDNQQAFVAQLDAVVPPSRNALQVIERLETATQGLNIRLEVSRIDEGLELKPGEEVVAVGESASKQKAEKGKAESGRTSQIFPLFITITATGRPEDLIEYIDAVEHVQELSEIQKYTISPVTVKAGADTEAGSSFQLLMTVIFYLQGRPDGTIK